MKGKLYICSTPIGNLGDITMRTIEVLNKVDMIASEDTRHTLKLLNYYNIKKPLTSYHKHNLKEKGKEIVKEILEGKNIALVSDAGTPCISDPGSELVKEAIEKDIEIVGLPGATASILALTMSGFSTDKFIFEGFLSAKKNKRRKELKELYNEKRTVILYESPHRIEYLLKDMDDIYIDRRLVLARELTKKFQEINRGSAKQIIDEYKDRVIKGEIVLLIEGYEEEEKNIDEIDIKKELFKKINQGLSKKEAVKEVSKEQSIPKRDVYKESIDIDRQDG